MLDLNVGDFVFVERYPDDIDYDDKPLNAYYGGEIIVTGVGEFSFTGAKSGGGYDLQSGRNYALRGPDRWHIASKRTNLKLLADVVQELKAFEKEGKSQKPKWIQSVYSSATGVRRKFESILHTETEETSFHDKDGIILAGDFYPAPPNMEPTFQKRS